MPAAWLGDFDENGPLEHSDNSSINSYCTGTAALHEDGRGLIQHATNTLQVRCDEK